MSSLSTVDALPSLAKYELLEELGHGGMATVYRARDVRLDREVAVKVIHRHLRDNTEVAIRFAAEARAVAKLRHPNIVEVYDVSAEEEAEKYLVVELSRGKTLRQLLSEHVDTPPEIAALIGVELASALSHAHSAGVVHRDIKPENVLIETGEGGAIGAAGPPRVSVKLTDFGIAKILDAQGVTSTGQVLGSPAHMAPEQIEGGNVDGRADVFGLGVLLYECMVGHLPFEGKNPAQVLRRVLDGSYAAADREKPEVGGRWAKVLACAIAKDASDRYRSADALGDALRSELDALEVTDAVSELSAFFGDHDGYRARHASTLVPRLIKRGEAAQKAGDPVGAADDFNRALAYAPQDPALIKIIAGMRRGRARKKVLAVALLVLVGSAFLGAVGVGISRLVARRAPETVSTRSDLAAVTGSVVVRPAAPAPPTPLSSVPPVQPPLAVARTDRAKHGEPAPVFKDVLFKVRPQGALLSIDGGSLEAPPFGQTKRLAVGLHTFRAEVPKSRCCKTLTKTEEIRPDDGSGRPQEVVLSLEFRDAMLLAPDAPPGATISCPLLGVSGPASQVFRIPMQAADVPVSCDLDAPGLHRSAIPVTLRPGESTNVPWPAP
jgi:eukaryotic-like serine/threonine-protein kinase